MKFSIFPVLSIGLLVIIGAGCAAELPSSTSLQGIPSTEYPTEMPVSESSIPPSIEESAETSVESESETAELPPASTDPVAPSTVASELQDLADAIVNGLGDIDAGAANY